MRDLFETEHEDFRRTARTFMEKEVKPFTEQWDRDGIVPSPERRTPQEQSDSPRDSGHRTCGPSLLAPRSSLIIRQTESP